MSPKVADPTPAMMTKLLLFMFVFLSQSQMRPTLAVCPRAQRRDYDCNSCTDGHAPTTYENLRKHALEPLGLNLPTIANYTPDCEYVMATCRRDGTGSQMQAKLSAYAFAQLSGITYVHTPILLLDHISPQEQNKMTSAVEQFFNLGLGEMSIADAARDGKKVCSVLSCFSFFDDYGHIDCWDMVRFQLLRKYRSTPKPRSYFRHERQASLTVAIHIRRGDVNSFKETDGDRFNSNEYYIDVLHRIQKVLPPQLHDNMDIVVLSEGEPAEFDSIVKAFPTTRLYLGSDLLRSFHTLAVADIFVMARSSMSYTAAIYNDGIVVYDPYWHKMQPGWVMNDKANETVLISMLNNSASRSLIMNRLRSRQPWNRVHDASGQHGLV